MVLGHGSCGAVDATIKSVEGHTTLPGHLPSLADAIAPAVKAVISHRESARQCNKGKRRAQRAGPDECGADPQRAHATDKKVRVVGGIYDLATGKVDVFVEAPALNADGDVLYFHRLDGGKYHICRVTRNN